MIRPPRFLQPAPGRLTRCLRLGLILLGLQGLAFAADPTILETLLQKNLEARGGADRLSTLHALRFSGETTVSGGIKFTSTKLVAQPNRIRQETTFQGLTGVDVYDQGQGWRIDPFGGRKDPERTSEDESKSLAHEANLKGVLIGWKEVGSQVEYQGTEDVDGTQAHKLKVTLKDGTTKVVYLDPDHFLEIRILTRLTVRGSLQESEVDLGEYAQAGGVWFPMAMEYGSPGAPRQAFLKWTKVEANPPVDEAMFRFPAASKK